jgi:hypothetical protein
VTKTNQSLLQHTIDQKQLEVSMRFKFVASVALITAIVGVALAWRNTTIRFQAREPATIKVVIDQLPAEAGVIPIELGQSTITSSASNKLEEFTYIIRNNSTRAIIALAVIKTITYEEGGKLYDHSVYSMTDGAFHPDMGSAKLFQPGTQMSMESAGPLSFDEDVVIKEITLKVDYASYADHTVYGSGREGERRINAMREGAQKYKSWLGQKYWRDRKSLTTILPLIQQPNVPEELELNPDQTMGADRYRLHLLKTLQTKGAADVEKYLTQDR